jgi:hypothetical protein
MNIRGISPALGGVFHRNGLLRLSADTRNSRKDSNHKNLNL